MADLSSRNPLGRFAGKAKLYSQYRPDYPAQLFDYLWQHCGLHEGAVVADVGAGTGISSRQLAERGLTVVGIEPNDDMRAMAQDDITAPLTSRLTYRAGQAENTGLPAQSCDLVVCAQAFHWFKAQPALAEFARILKPGRHVALVWNETNVSDSFTAEYETLWAAVADCANIERTRRNAGEALLDSPLFHNARTVEFAHSQMLDEDGLLGRVFSCSYAPQDAREAEQFSTSMRALFNKYAAADGTVTLVYRTTLFLARL